MEKFKEDDLVRGESSVDRNRAGRIIDIMATLG